MVVTNKQFAINVECEHCGNRLTHWVGFLDWEMISNIVIVSVECDVCSNYYEAQTTPEHLAVLQINPELNFLNQN